MGGARLDLRHPRSIIRAIVLMTNDARVVELIVEHFLMAETSLAFAALEGGRTGVDQHPRISIQRSWSLSAARHHQQIADDVCD